MSGLVIDLTLSFAVGASWYICGRYFSWACDCKLQIGYVDDTRFTSYTFGGIDSWMSLALVVGVISAMDIVTIIDTCDYLWIRCLFLTFQLVHDIMIFLCDRLCGFLFG